MLKAQKLKPPPFPEKQFIVLSGVPGSGKTTIDKNLSKDGFYFFETDSRLSEFISELSLGVDDFVTRWLKRYDHMWLEWGFKVSCLPYVLRFKSQGGKLLWFTCDKDIARSNYLKAHPNDPEGKLWGIQVKEIEVSRLPTNDFVIVKTYRDGSPISFKELRPKIFSKR